MDYIHSKSVRIFRQGSTSKEVVTTGDTSHIVNLKDKPSQFTIGIIATAILSFGYHLYEPTPPTPEEISARNLVNANAQALMEERAKIPTTSQAIENLKFDFEWRDSGFGSIMMIDIKAKNNNKFAVKDFKVVCELSGESGTAIDRVSKTVFKLIDAGKSVRVKELNMGFMNSQTNTAACRVTDLVIV